MQNERILSALSGGEWVTRAELGHMTGLSTRQITRIKRDFEEVGYRIESSRLGLRLLSSNKSTPAYLTATETLLLAMATRALLSRLKEPLRSTWLSLVQRLGERLSPSSQKMLDQASIQIGENPPSGQLANPGVLEDIQRSLAGRLQLRILYQGSKDQEPKSRLVQPQCLFLIGQSWYLQALDGSTTQERHFKVTRIHEATVVALPVDTLHLLNPQPYFHRWDLTATEPVRITLEINPSLEQWLHEHPIHPSQRLEAGYLNVEIRDLEKFADWVLSLRQVRPVGPTAFLNVLGRRLEDWRKIVGDIRCHGSPVTCISNIPLEASPCT